MKLFLLTIGIISNSALSNVWGESFPAHYSVPLPLGSTLNGQFSMPPAEVDHNGANWHLKYNLPEDLTADHAPQIDLSGNAGPGQSWEMDGKFGHANCSRTASEVSCEVAYSRIIFSSLGVEDFLAQKYSNDPSQVKNQLAVFAHFSGDPIGVITIELPETSGGTPEKKLP
jgi:hypothetical protein